MQKLPIEIIRVITNYLDTNQEVVYLLSVTKGSDALKTKFMFDKFPFCKYINITKDIPYYKNISIRFYVRSSEMLKTIPKHTRHICYDYKGSFSECYIPKTVTHFTFGMNFSSKECIQIPNTVTHLEHHSNISLSPFANVPDSVTHLTISDNTYQNSLFYYYIPPSVSHLVFDVKLVRTRNLITKTLKSIEFTFISPYFESFYELIKIPSLTKLIFRASNPNKELNMDKIPNHITEIVFYL